MSKRKPRKSAYIPPAHEVANRKQRASKRDRGVTPRRIAGSGGARTGRRVEPPSLQRILRRAPVALVAFFALQWFVINASAKGKDLDTVDRLLQAAAPAIMMTLVFVPLSYMMDRSMYRAWQRRQRIKE